MIMIHIKFEKMLNWHHLLHGMERTDHVRPQGTSGIHFCCSHRQPHCQLPGAGPAQVNPEPAYPPLLLRQSKRILPNDAVRLCYQYCQEVLALIAQGHEALDELRDGVTGVLELRCHEAFVRGWFSGVVENFMEEHEGIEVSIRTQRQQPEAMREAICVWLGSVPEGNFRCEVLGHLTQGVYGSPAYFRNRKCPQSPSEPDEHVWIDMPGGDEEGVELRHSALGTCPIRPRPGRFSVDQYSVWGDAIAA